MTYRTRLKYTDEMRSYIRPLERKRSPQGLSLAEREEISRGLASGLSMREIAGPPL